MLEYKTTGIIRVNGGYVGLDKKQAAARSHRIKPAKDDGVYEVLRPVMFKAGEVVRLDNPGKVKLQSLELTEKSKADLAAQKPVEPEPVKTEPASSAPAKKSTPKKAAKKR